MILSKAEKNKPTQFSYTCHNCSNTYFANSPKAEMMKKNKKEINEFFKKEHRKPMHCRCGEQFNFKNKI
jgi:hypothetical protein